MSSSMRAALNTVVACLMVFGAACRTVPPADLDLSLGKLSVHMQYRVTLIAPDVPPRINQLHSWQVRVTDVAGVPVLAARFQVGGGMPQHGHGFPTQPRITRELGDGLYLLEGMKFSMTGWWEIRLSITAAAGTDQVVFNTVVGRPGAAGNGATALRDRWSEQELEVLASMHLPQAGTRVVDPSNRYERDVQAAKLGRALFEDNRLSRDGKVACSTCHVAEQEFQDDRALAQGVGAGRRRTMPVMGASGAPFLFWDGRKDSLWSQALGPLEDAAEHGFDRARVTTVIRTHYRAEYEKVFGGLPVPAEPAAREDINRVFANVGKAIAAYEVQLDYDISPFDRYIEATLAGDGSGQASLDAQQERGLRLFIGKGQCATCHNGALLTDHAFHNTGVPPRAGAADQGRAEGVKLLLADEFNCLGRYSDARPEQCGELRFLAADDPRMVGAFRTPGLRDVALRAPYMHAGQFATLEQVVGHYARSPRAAVGHSELARAGESPAERQPIRLTKHEVADIAAFLRALSRQLPGISSAGP